jgi:uncharacterized OsmC-like protein
LSYPREVNYSIETNWDRGTGGYATFGDHMINFDTPIEFGGEGKAPCPDQLFLASLSGCILDTFINFKNRLEVETTSVKLKTSTKVKLNSKGFYSLEDIRILFKIQCEKVFLKKNRRCAELACEYCHLTKSIESVIPIKIKIDLSESG